MSYKISKTGEITIEGFDNGIAVSPHKGIANIQAGNIATESGEVMCNFNRISEVYPNTLATGTFNFVDGSHLAASIPLSKAPPPLSDAVPIIPR